MSAFCGRLDTLGSMQASEELDDGQVRQMLFDLESSYNAFNNVLHDNWSLTLRLCFFCVKFADFFAATDTNVLLI